MFVPHGGDAGAFSFEQNEMSVPGQSPRFDRGQVTSGLLPIADIVRVQRNQKDRQQRRSPRMMNVAIVDMIRLEKRAACPSL
jgi:hypothetical protein